MRPLWKGAISFGLVTIPVSLYPATRTEELTFRMLRKSDLSPINYKRVAEAGGKEVPWKEIVKGYEYEKGKYVVLKEDDLPGSMSKRPRLLTLQISSRLTLPIRCFFTSHTIWRWPKAATRPTRC